MLNSHLVTRQVIFVVEAVFARERRWSGPPQIRDGPNALRLYNSKFVQRLCLLLGPLEGGDLCLGLVVELIQHFMFMKDVLAIESCLLLIAI